MSEQAGEVGPMSMSSDPSDRGASKLSALAAVGMLFVAAILGGTGVWLYRQAEINQKSQEIDQLRNEVAAGNQSSGQSSVTFRFTKAENFKHPGQTFGPSTPREPDRYELYITFEIKNNSTEPYPFSPDKDIKVKNATTNATLPSCVLNPLAAGYDYINLREQVIQPGETVVGYRSYCAGSDPEGDQKAFTVYLTNNSTKETQSISVTAVVRPLPYALAS